MAGRPAGSAPHLLLTDAALKISPSMGYFFYLSLFGKVSLMLFPEIFAENKHYNSRYKKI